jgi:hypothetical protein
MKCLFAELEKNKTYNGEIEYEDGTREKHRFVAENERLLFVFAPRYRRQGWRIAEHEGKFVFNGKVIKYFIITPEKSPVEEYIDDLLKYKNYIEKYSLPGTWQELKEDIARITPEKIEELRKYDGEIKSHFEAWEKAGEIGLLRIEKYKTTTLTSNKMPIIDHQRLKEAIKNREDIIIYWRGSYDYSVHCKKCEDGDYRMWFSAEYKGCGNGHYYLLLDDNHCIFVEDD